MDDAGAGLIVLLLRDPHLLEGGEGSQDGASDPDGVLPLWRSDDLDLHGGRGHASDFLLHAVSDTGVHGGTSRKDGVGVQILGRKCCYTAIFINYDFLGWSYTAMYDYFF